MEALRCQGCGELCETYQDRYDGELSKCCGDPVEELDVTPWRVDELARVVRPYLRAMPDECRLAVEEVFLIAEAATDQL